MVHHVEENYIKRNLPFIQINGVSQIHLSMLKAAGLEILNKLKDQKNMSNEVGIKKGIDSKIHEINATLKFPIFANVLADEYFLEAGTTAQNIVFISYDSIELALAEFIRDILQKWGDGYIKPFVAKRDIKFGADPNKVMLFDNLLQAKAIIPICSHKSKTSPWLWWETAAVWAKGNKIYPLFTNLTPNQFGVPLINISQGKEFFNLEEFTESINHLCRDINQEHELQSLTKDEIVFFNKLKAEYSKPEMSAEINVSYKKHDQRQEYHKYSLILDVINKTDQRFNDVVLELAFPVDYILKKKWEYPGLISYEIDGKPGYIGLTFTFNSIHDGGKKVFSNSLLPGKTLRIFGDGGMFGFEYEMDQDRWDSRAKYDVTWKVYINGGAPIEGTRRFIEMQNF